VWEEHGGARGVDVLLEQIFDDYDDEFPLFPPTEG
jgi:hypothetical protein